MYSKMKIKVVVVLLFFPLVDKLVVIVMYVNAMPVLGMTGN